jgi:hypothetical protein
VVALAYRASSAANNAGTTVSTVTVTLPTGTAANDLVYIVCSVGAVYTSPVDPAGWATSHNTNSDATGRTFIAYKTIASADTNPVFSWTGAGKTAYTAITLQPTAGLQGIHAGFIGPTVNATATSHTSPAYVAGAQSGASVLLTGYRGGANVATAITTTPPTGWTEPASNADTSTATGTTAATRQVAAWHAYNLAQTGTITPGAQTVSATAVANLYHAFAIEGSFLATPPTVISRGAIYNSFYW